MTGERGSSSAELVLLIPAVIAILLLTVLAGRLTSSAASLHDAADIAARNASLASWRSAQQIAVETARRDLNSSHVACLSLNVTSQRLTVGGLGAVQVKLACRVSSVGIGLSGLPTLLLTATSISVIDRYRKQ